MWKLRKKEASPVAQLSWPTAACDAPARDVPPETPSAEASHVESSRIGKSMMVKGEVSGSEDLYVDGEVEGSVALQEHSLIIGPNGRVRADVVASDVIVRGTLDGNVLASERVELKQAAVLVGDIVTPRIVIEDGACFKGSIDVHKEAAARHAESIERPLGGRKAS
jgi:cytoskeletal protein CcmA (bactofilin family)